MCHWAGGASNTRNARGDVFGKQAGFSFAEFLLLFVTFLKACLCWINSESSISLFVFVDTELLSVGEVFGLT